MVKITTKRKSSQPSNVVPTIAGMGLLLMIGLLGWNNETIDVNGIVSEFMKSAAGGGLYLSSVENSSFTAQALKQCRQKVKDQCKAANNIEQVSAITAANKACFKMPKKDAVPQQPRGEAAFRRCKHVFMDFGANVGDTSGHVIDAGMVDCGNQRQMAQGSLLVHFTVTEKDFVDTKRRNPLTRNIAKLIEDDGESIGAEDYCYYGVEGNPVFTERLRAVEDFVMAMQPKPLQHMHFFTESVGAGQDGPTKLFLDTVNKEENFWGSSIMSDHQDVRKSAEHSKAEGGTGEKVTADVMGYTIGTLMRQTLQAFAPDATPEQKKGNHLILKVDIEGGEYPLMAQASEDTTLCEFVAMGNKADLFIEFHSIRVTGQHPWLGKQHQFKKKLTECGVTFRGLQAWWA